MDAPINKLVQSLLQKDNLEQCSLPELQLFASQYPYFGAAQLLLTKKLQGADDEQYNEQLQKTSLLFRDPLWLEYLLHDTGNAEIIKATPAVATVPLPEQPATESSAEDKEEEKEPVTFDEIKTEPIIPLQEEQEPVTPISSLKIEPIDPSKAAFVFEPYHTVDYFASQGIKFKEEEKPRDKFGQQLKSFTDWLKTMKPLQASETPVLTGIEKKVEQLAEHSIEDRDVITEAMAEVWEKQGNMTKAIDIYNKLSLLDPSKSAYFAAKIEVLKKLN